MNKQLFSLQIATSVLSIKMPMAVVAVCLGLASTAAAAEQSADPGSMPPSAQEESVLIATREAPPSPPPTAEQKTSLSDGEMLEPISQSSDYTPELATATDHQEPAVSFGEALAKASKSKAKPDNPPADKATTESENAPDAKPAPQNSTPPVAEEPQCPIDCNDAPSAGSSRRATAARAHGAHFEPVKFQGVMVGRATKHALITAWGQPADTIESNDGEVLVYQKSPFKVVEALIGAKEIVASIKIELATPLESKQLAGQLGLDRFDPVVVTDETDQPVCQAYPERGVLFMFAETENSTPVSDDAAGDARVRQISHVIIQPIDPCAFAFRAEKRLHGPYTQNINDLKAAISLDPEFGRAYWLLARVYLATGQADVASAAIAEACDIEPENASFQLCRAQVSELLGDYDNAVLAVRAVLDRHDLAEIDRAQALHQMAQLASLGDREIASKAIPFETKAIEIADTLATSDDPRERRAAKQLLIESHVTVAEEIARQPFNEKVESLSEWLGRASGLAEDYIAKDGGSVELRLYIAQHALSALAGFKPTLDPTSWIDEAEEAAQTLLAQSNDEVWQQRIKWELGIAYLHALRVEHTRRGTEAALKYGQLAIDNLAVGASSRQAVHSSEQLVGQLYFQMGAVYAVHKLDHAKAVQWYEKAAPLLTGKRPPSELYAPRREGEMLVSMGVSFWQVQNQTKALDLTQTGVALVETAVAGGILSKSTLAVPYSNLSTMYQQMGESTNAAKYAELAKSVASNDAKQQSQMPRLGRGQQQQRRMALSR